MTTINLAQIANIIDKINREKKPLTTRSLFNQTIPKCSWSNCTKNSRSIVFNSVTPAKEGTTEVCRGVLINVKLLRKKMIEKTVTIMNQGEIGSYCEYHEYELSTNSTINSIETILNSKAIIQVTENEFYKLRVAEDAEWDYVNLDIYLGNEKIMDSKLLKDKHPNRHNIDFNWKRKNVHGKVEHVEEYQRIFNDIKELIYNEMKKRGGDQFFSTKMCKILVIVTNAILDDFGKGNVYDTELYLKEFGVYDLIKNNK